MLKSRLEITQPYDTVNHIQLLEDNPVNTHTSFKKE